MKILKTLFYYLPFTWASTSNLPFTWASSTDSLPVTPASAPNVSTKLTTRPDDLKQLNESVWEFYKPLGGDADRPKLEILFFHGAQLFDDREAFWRTWLSRDGDVLWPTAWLAPKFPGARILFISYDSSIRKSTDSSGQKDTFQTTENLMHDIVWSSTCKAGQTCPVIFVGHCFGGIIIKDFLITCSRYTARKAGKDLHVKETKMLLQQCKAIFYYSTPNAGSRLMDGLAYKDYVLGNVNQSIVDFLQILSRHTARINSEFSDLRQSQNPRWVTRGVGETLQTRLGNSKKTVMVVPQASAREQDLDSIYWGDVDHFDVAKAKNYSSCPIFSELKDLLALYYHNDKQHIVTFPLPFGQDNKYVPILHSTYEIMRALEREHKCHVVTLYGEPGLGKTSLVKYIALQYQPHHTPQGCSSVVFPDGVFFLRCGQGGERKIKQLQQCLLQSLGCGSEAVPTNIPEERDGDYIAIPQFRRRLQFKLKDLKALIILDDVWELTVLEELILSRDEARSVKYLLTSQIADIWPDAVSVPMETPTLEEATQILLNYTSGLSTKADLPENIQVIANSIIHDLGRHPLTLANVGLGFQEHEVRDPEVWRTVRHSWLHEPPMNESHGKALMCGIRYPLALDTTMTRIVSSLEEPSRNLLFMICALDNLHASETVVQHLYKWAETTSLQMGRNWKRERI